MKSDASELIGPMCKVIQHYQEYMAKVRYPRSKYDDPIWKRNNKLGSYGFVPSTRPIAVIRALQAALGYLTKKTGNIDFSFLDAGCGVGNILLLAYSAGFTNVTGIELDKRTARIARSLITRVVNMEHSCKIIRADLLEHTKYKSYDVIYYYQPMRHDCMDGFLNLLKKNMKIGAVVIVNGSDMCSDDKKFKRILKLLDVKPIDGIYEKIK